MLKIDSFVTPDHEPQYLLEQMRQQDIAYMVDDLEGFACHQAKASALLHEPRYQIIEAPTPEIEMVVVCLPPVSASGVKPSGWIVTREDRMLRQIEFLSSASAPLQYLVNTTEPDQTLLYQLIEPHLMSGIDDRNIALFELLKQNHDLHVQVFQLQMASLPHSILEDVTVAIQLMENRLLNTVFKLLKANLHFDLVSHIPPKNVAPNLYNWFACHYDQADQNRKLAAWHYDAEFVAQIVLGIPQRINAIPHYRHGHPAHYLNHLLANDTLSPQQAVDQVKHFMDDAAWQLVREVQEEQGVILS